MRIGIIGAGNIGATAARLFIAAGHEVWLSNSRGPESLGPLIAELGPRARAATVDDAAASGELVLLAIPWRTPEGLPRPERVAGKVVIDAMNPYGPGGTLIDLGGSTSSEAVLGRLPGARLVKAFNTLRVQRLASEGRPGLPVADRFAIPAAGDDAAAKRIVLGLIEQIGFAGVDSGSLRDGGRAQQPGGPLSDQVLDGRRMAALVNDLAEVSTAPEGGS